MPSRTQHEILIFLYFESSNSSPSATQSEVQRIPLGLFWKFGEMGAIAILFLNRTGENVIPNAEGKLSGFFSLERMERSGFSDFHRG